MGRGTAIVLAVAALGAGCATGVAAGSPPPSSRGATRPHCAVVSGSTVVARHRSAARRRACIARACDRFRGSAKRRCVKRVTATKPTSTGPSTTTTPATTTPSGSTAPTTPETTTSTTTTTTPVAPPRLQVISREYTLRLSRPTVAAGAVTIELANRGEDPHDLVIEPAGGGAAVSSFGEIDAGGLATRIVTLSTGSYKLYCSLPGHEVLGMRVTLLVS